MDKIVINTKQRMLNVLVGSIQNVIDDAQTPKSKGGRMRVDTGFLRASGVASVNNLPVGDSIGRRRLPDETAKPLPQYAKEDKFSEGAAINKILLQLKIGDVFYFGWTARYAKYREVDDGFLEAAIMNWKKYVDEEVQYYRNKDARK